MINHKHNIQVLKYVPLFNIMAVMRNALGKTLLNQLTIYFT